MPIKGLSESVRLPRIGKIHLGTRHPEKGYPMKSDHFVLPSDHTDYQKLVDLFGEKPKELRILIPVEKDETWREQYYKAYSQTYGLICKGDGETALRMIDVKTKELPKANVAGAVSLEEIPCLGPQCPEYRAEQCSEVMNLRFLIPEIPGLGIWQIDTGSKNSILNINSCATIIKRAFGRISLIPLKLTFEKIQVNNPEDGKKQTVYVLNLRTDVTLAQLASQAKEQAKMFMIEGPDLEAVFDAQVEKDIDELWGEKPVVKQPEAVSFTPDDATSTGTEEQSGELPNEQVEGIDLDWIKETMETTKFRLPTLVSWLKSKANYTKLDTTGKIEDIISRMTKPQKEFLSKYLQDRLDMA